MSGKKSWVDDNTYRVTSDDGKRSWLYESDGNPLSPDVCTEVADHNEDGTTDAYEYDGGIFADLFFGSKGSKK